ncbi:hypothetical protein CPB86DRAFT_800825 [Serendipita vermifera]|nr:hypothetical protein CPB86DRAFT_800825 [Serendipita vermifera]
MFLLPSNVAIWTRSSCVMLPLVHGHPFISTTSTTPAKRAVKAASSRTKPDEQGPAIESLDAEGGDIEEDGSSPVDRSGVAQKDRENVWETQWEMKKRGQRGYVRGLESGRSRYPELAIYGDGPPISLNCPNLYLTFANANDSCACLKECSIGWANWKVDGALSEFPRTGGQAS